MTHSPQGPKVLAVMFTHPNKSFSSPEAHRQARAMELLYAVVTVVTRGEEKMVKVLLRDKHNRRFMKLLPYSTTDRHALQSGIIQAVRLRSEQALEAPKLQRMIKH